MNIKFSLLAKVRALLLPIAALVSLPAYSDCYELLQKIAFSADVRLSRSMADSFNKNLLEQSEELREVHRALMNGHPEFGKDLDEESYQKYLAYLVIDPLQVMPGAVRIINTQTLEEGTEATRELRARIALLSLYEELNDRLNLAREILQNEFDLGEGYVARSSYSPFYVQKLVDTLFADFSTEQMRFMISTEKSSTCLSG